MTRRGAAAATARLAGLAGSITATAGVAAVLLARAAACTSLTHVYVPEKLKDTAGQWHGLVH